MRLSNGEVLLSWPLAEHVITAGWFYNDGSAHSAIDLRTNQGGSIIKPVYASEAGTVDWVQHWNGYTKTGNQSYGNLIRIRHASYNGSKLQTYYAHLSSILVSNGQSVKEGDLIGYTGESGYCLGAHLHFEVRLNGVRHNPLNWLDADFTTTSSAVRLGSYKSVERPVTIEMSLQKIYISDVPNAAAMKIFSVCNDRKLVEASLYHADYTDREESAQNIDIGPVSNGDASAIFSVVKECGLNDGRYRSQFVYTN